MATIFLIGKTKGQLRSCRCFKFEVGVNLLLFFYLVKEKKRNQSGYNILMLNCFALLLQIVNSGEFGLQLTDEDLYHISNHFAK